LLRCVLHIEILTLHQIKRYSSKRARSCPLYKVESMESQEKNEPREGRAKGHRTARSRPGIDKTRSSRIVLVLRGLVSAARARIALPWTRRVPRALGLSDGFGRV